MLIAGALCLMAARRCVTLYGIVTNGPDSPAELVAHLVTLAISLFALGGVACIGPLFRSMQRADAVARESLTRFQEMTDLLPDMLCELDADLNVTYANRAAFATLGYVQEELDAGIKMSRCTTSSARTGPA
jgi:PAS domain-containing protein